MNVFAVKDQSLWSQSEIPLKGEKSVTAEAPEARITASEAAASHAFLKPNIVLKNLGRRITGSERGNQTRFNTEFQ